jgi:mono/diheme cytochrome c family protein
VIALVTFVASVASGCAPANADARPDGEAVLRKYCVRCHSGPRARGDFDFVASTPQLIARGLIVPGDPARSALFERVKAGEMPPQGVRPRPNAAEIARLGAWIRGMATTTRFRRDEAIASALESDAAALAASARPFARWLTLTHLANAGLPGDVLARYRIAVAELLASLSWSAVPPSVIAVDAERTIFRIDLRELGWSAATWDAIRASYPYGVARGPRVPDAIRADWFVAAASRAPLYHAILELPETAAALGQRLGIDLADNVAAGRVARAGFNSSGVSVNNRVVERHATRFGALWRSYDFSSSVGAENVFAHPLDFVPAGGELIFNLPNGLQAYMLVDATGRRIDKAPTAIVSDPRRPDRAVATAVSCFGCHASGIIDRADQVRDATRGLAGADRARVTRLYPVGHELSALYTRDRERFAVALAALAPGLQPAGLDDEPITALALHHEAELALPLAAAELGLTSDELTARLERAPAVRPLLGALAAGGTVKRDAWETAFPSTVTALRVGIPTGSREVAHGREPRVWLDRDHRSWVRLDDAADHRAAIAGCSGALALPRDAELADAIAEGLTAGLAVTSPIWSAGIKLDASNQRYAMIVDPVRGAVRRADLGERHVVVCVQK